MRRFAETMHGLNKPFEIEWVDAGHGSMAADRQIRFQERAMSFARKGLGR